MISVRQICLVLLAVFTLASCSGSPKSEFYTLSSVAPVSTGAKLGITVAIGPTELPRELERNQIVTRVNPNQVQINETERWAGSLGFSFDQTIADNLERSLPAERVIAYPAQPRVAVDYRVLLEVRQFDGTPGESVTLRGNWTIVSAKDELVAVEKFDIEQPTNGGGFDALVEAHSQAIATLSESIRSGLINAKVTPASGDVPGS